MKPVLNWEHMPRGDMLHLLSMFTAVCDVRDVETVTAEDVAQFLTDKGRPDLVQKFSPAYLRGGLV